MLANLDVPGQRPWGARWGPKDRYLITYGKGLIITWDLDRIRARLETLGLDWTNAFEIDSMANEAF